MLKTIPLDTSNPDGPASNSSSTELISQALNAIRDAVDQLTSGGGIDAIDLSSPLPFSRADGADYLHLVQLWNQSQTIERAQLGQRNCPACASIDHRALFRSYDGYPFHGCTICGTWFVPLAIEESLIEAFFDRIPEARRIADKMMHGREVKTKVADRERFFSYFDLISPILNAKPGSTRYLDIGCGVGHSVELGKELGFNALGLEVSRTALATARHSDRNVQHPGDWQGKETFDLISLFETLEHVTRPDSLMAQARQCLAPGGLLLITVPNVQCWEIQLLRERCFHVFGGFEGVGHINLFSPEGLSRLFERHGLCLVHADGQFSNNPLDIAGRLLDQRASATAAFAKGTLASSLPRELHTILNALGPDLAVLDRANLRSPILIAVACRKEDVEQLAPSIEQLRQARSRDLMGALSKPRPPATPAAVPPPPEPILPPAPLFTAHTPIAGFLNADTERLLGARGFTSSVASGLSLRSAEPLRFQRMATLGSGKLAAGTYEIAAQLKLRRGLITLSLFDDAKQAWATNLAIEPNDTEVRTTFTLAADSDVTLYVCAHNSDAPRPVDVDIFALGIAALDATARLILPPPPPEPIHVLSPAPLFTAHAPIAGFLNADTERLLGARGFTDSVVSGLSLRSAEPLRFQRMATLGSGKLAAGTYEIAAQLKLRRGLVTLSLFDDAKQAWATNLAVEPNDTEVRATFTLAADSDVTLYACAHNSEAPRPVDVDIFALGIAALDATARLILPPPPPEPIHVLSPAPLFTAHAPIAGFLNADTERLLGARGFTDSVVSGLSLRSAEPLRFQRMATLGSGKLAAGTYEIAAQLKLRRGLVTLSLFDDAKQAWVTNLAVEPNDTEVRATFTLAADSDVTLYVCAHNSEAPRPVDVDIFALGIAALDATARLIPQPPAPPIARVRAPIDLFASLPDGKPLKGFLLPAFAALAPRDRVSGGLEHGLSFRSAAPLRFEYLAEIANGKLAKGRYGLAAAAHVFEGHLSLNLLDQTRGQWTTSISFDADRYSGAVTFELEADTTCKLYLCANNSDAPAPVHIDLHAIGLAALGEGHLIVDAPTPPPTTTTALAKQPVRSSRRLLASFRELASGLPLGSSSLAKPLPDGPGRIRRRAATLAIGKTSALREYLHKGAEIALQEGHYALRIAGRVDAGALAIGLLDVDRDAWIINVGLSIGECWSERVFDIPAPLHALLIVSGNNADTGPISAEITAIDLHAILGPDA